MLSGREMMCLTELNKKNKTWADNLFKKRYKRVLKAAHKRIKEKYDSGNLEMEVFDVYDKMLKTHIL